MRSGTSGRDGAGVMAFLRGVGTRWRQGEGQPSRLAAEVDLLHRMRRELRDLDIHPPLDMGQLCQALGAKRGRPIELEARHLPTPGPSGLWVETNRRDVIVYRAETTRLHQEHIILHELGHIITADEASDEESAEEAAANWSALIPVFEPEMVQRVTQRCSYESEEECAIEAAATCLLEWSSVQGATPMSDDPSLRRVQAALGDQRGWR